MASTYFPKEEISAQEKYIEVTLDNFEGADNWRAAVAASRAALEKELAFIEDAVVLRPIRYLDVRDAFHIELLRLRLAYLRLLRTEYDGIPDESLVAAR